MNRERWNHGLSEPVLYRCPRCEHDGPRGIVAVMQLLASHPEIHQLTCRACGVIWGPVESNTVTAGVPRSGSTLAGRG
jgi:hypothetical protein